ncbi:hypothetical protein ACZ90_28320 [Streptomyces albus subsp. albus]|nr:hypothetical protein ACZ90_28320 [Streptomyces albus subsp. albus]
MGSARSRCTRARTPVMVAGTLNEGVLARVRDDGDRPGDARQLLAAVPTAATRRTWFGQPAA